MFKFLTKLTLRSQFTTIKCKENLNFQLITNSTKAKKKVRIKLNQVLGYQFFCWFKTEIENDNPNGYLILIHKKICGKKQKMGPNLSNSSPVALVFWDNFGLDVDKDRRNMLWFGVIQILMFRIRFHFTSHNQEWAL